MTNAVLLLIGLAALAAVSWYIKHNRGGTGDQYDAAQLSDAVRALAALSEELENVDTLLADLRACSPRSLLRFFRANWCGIDGKNRHINFLTDGRNGQTAGLRQAAQEQRDRLNAEIIDTVRAMAAALDAGVAPALTVDAVDETVDETAEPVTVGEW